MGASEFTDVGRGKTAQEAFDKLVKDAQYEHGHGGYTGTIAEKHNFVTIGTEATLEDALARAANLLDANDKRVADKWGSAGCIEVNTVGTSNTRVFVFFGVASD
jgi:hypothetical protein